MENTANNFKLDLLKSILVGVSVSLALILVFALVLKFVDIPDFWIRTVNQVIKLIAIVSACFVGVKKQKGLVKGVTVGFLVVAITYLLFGLVSGSLSFGWGTLLEATYGIFCGALAGIICVNLKK